MEFAAVILVMMLYYIRPQEWIPDLQPLKPVTLVSGFAVVAVFLKTRFSLKEIFKTPHDWLMFLYCFWMVWASPSRGETFHQVYPLFLFYLVVVHSLSNLRRLGIFLLVWMGMIFVISSLALVSPYGFDPTDAEYATLLFKGRKTLGTSIFRNPNALGHSVVPSIMMIYFMFVWKRPIFVRITGLPLFAVPLYCIYLTMSKGAFISAFAAAVAALSFGRRTWVQILIVIFAVTFGWGAMKALPRMYEMENSKKDEAIQGRVAAFTFGMETYKESYKGFGFKNFARTMYDRTGLAKAAHSSYVQVGGELGKVGFGLFFGVIYCCLKTLAISKSRNDNEERARRILFTILISYLISSWMVDFAYHAEIFFCAGAVAAYHRLLSPKPQPEVSFRSMGNPAPVPVLQIEGLQPSSPAAAATMGESRSGPPGSSAFSPEQKEASTIQELQPAGIQWNRLGLVDIALIFAMQWVAVMIWRYAIKTM